MRDCESEETRPHRRALQAARSGLVLAVSVAAAIAALMIMPLLLIGLLFWAVDGAWEFEGTGFRHWLFVKGSRLERLGVVEPLDAAPVRYSISLQEGTFPGWNIAIYESRAEPAAVVAAYAERCGKLGFKVTQRVTHGIDRATLVCEIEPYIDVEVGADRTDRPRTRVFLKVWGTQ